MPFDVPGVSWGDEWIDLRNNHPGPKRVNTFPRLTMRSLIEKNIAKRHNATLLDRFGWFTDFAAFSVETIRDVVDLPGEAVKQPHFLRCRLGT